MLKNKILNLLIIVLVCITLIIVTVFLMVRYGHVPGLSSSTKSHTAKTETKQLSATEISDLTYQMDDILTDLKTNNDYQYIKIGFAFQLSNKASLGEMKSLDFRVKSRIIQTLSDLTPNQIEGSKGHDYLSAVLINKLNPLLQKGKITHIDITDFLLQ